MPLGELAGPLKVGLTVPLIGLLNASVPVMVTLNGVPAVCVPGLARLKVAKPPLATVNPAEPVIVPWVAVSVVAPAL